jgi:hypothetical protein
MQIKTIQKNIQAKMAEWLKTITDEKLVADVKDKLLVSGGSIASMFLNEPVNDYDVYLMDMDVCKRLAEYYTKTFSYVLIFDGRKKKEISKKYNVTDNTNSSMAISLRNLKDDQIKLYFNEGEGGMKINENIPKDQLNYTPLYFSPNAISLSNNLQIVLRFWGTPEQVHKTFDFVHATNYYTTKDGLVRNLAAVESILTKQLKYQGSFYPLTSIIRAKKFIKRGYNISAGELLKIMFQISLLDLTNPDIIEEQIIGIDVAYFDKLIDVLRAKMAKDAGFNLTSDYLNAIIDKVFGEAEDMDDGQ